MNLTLSIPRIKSRLTSWSGQWLRPRLERWYERLLKRPFVRLRTWLCERWHTLTIKQDSDAELSRCFTALVMLALLLFGTGSVGGKTSLYFVNDRHSALTPEQRELELVGSVESRAEQLTEAEVLGPMEKGRAPLLPAMSRVQSVMRRGNKLYIDLTVPDVADMDVSFSLVSSAIKKTIASNIPFAGHVVVFVNGEPAAR